MTMTVAIMQPYFLPYAGYFQLLCAADRFLVLDDVNFISRGWINRNRIHVGASPTWITLPLSKASQNREIREIEIHDDPRWRSKTLAMIERAFPRAPHLDEVLPLVREIVEHPGPGLSGYLRNSLRLLARYLDLPAEILPTSSCYPKGDLRGQGRILDLCAQLGADRYVNSIGGQELYDRETFAGRRIELSFVQTDLEAMDLELHHEESKAFSILELMVYNTPERLRRALDCYQLV